MGSVQRGARSSGPIYRLNGRRGDVWNIMLYYYYVEYVLVHVTWLKKISYPPGVDCMYNNNNNKKKNNNSV